MKVKIYITLKTGVLDPQGKAIEHSLKAIGFNNIENVRQGKLIEMYLKDCTRQTAYDMVQQMCEKLLANTTIENYSFELVEK